LEAISVDHLTKIYRNGKRALDDLSMTVQEGELFTLLGQNGAGKSTLINTLTTYLSPTSGLVKVFGEDLRKNPTFVRKQIACVAQHTSIDNHLSLTENMLFQSRLYKLDSALARKRIAELIESLELSAYIQHRVFTYSGGIKRRLDIAMSMVSHPRILFLDEPTVGLDVESRKAVWDILGKIRREFGTTIFMTTHYLEEADALSNTICIIQDGHELVQDTPKNLRKYTRQNLIKISLKTIVNMERLKESLSGLPCVAAIQSLDDTLIANVNDWEQGLVAINRHLIEQAVPYQSIGVIDPSLEHVYLNLIHAGKQRF
jgi:ABC-2 type transport system ATP-binding protein